MLKKILNNINNNINKNNNKNNINEVETIIMAAASIEDPTGWMLDNSISQFVLMPTSGIVYMCMFAYTFVHGTYLTDYVFTYYYYSHVCVIVCVCDCVCVIVCVI